MHGPRKYHLWDYLCVLTLPSQYLRPLLSLSLPLLYPHIPSWSHYRLISLLTSPSLLPSHFPLIIPSCLYCMLVISPSFFPHVALRPVKAPHSHLISVPSFRINIFLRRPSTAAPHGLSHFSQHFPQPLSVRLSTSFPFKTLLPLIHPHLPFLFLFLILFLFFFYFLLLYRLSR